MLHCRQRVCNLGEERAAGVCVYVCVCVCCRYKKTQTLNNKVFTYT